MKYPRHTIDTLCKRGLISLQTGPFGSQLHSYDYVEEGVPVIPTEAIRERRVDHTVLPKISEATARGLARHRLELNDILFARRGAQATGQTAIVREQEVGAICGTGAIRLRVAPSQMDIDPQFLSFFLSSAESITWIRAQAIGATMPNLNEGIIRRLSVPIPNIREQQRVAAALGALDDKIQVNRRMNETLEEIAQAIFRDWFVHYGPTVRKIKGATDPTEIMGRLVADTSHAQQLSKLFPPELGSDGMPNGWQEIPLGDVFDLTMGQSPPGSTYNEIASGLPFFQGTRDFGFRFPDERVWCSEPTRIAQSDWTLISVRAPVGDINRAARQCCIGRGVAAISHKKGLNSFTYYTALELKPKLARYDNDGTVFGSINQHQLKSLMTVGGNLTCSHAFDELVRPLDMLIRNNSEEMRNLATARDLLLPELMSGTIRLHDAAENVA